MEPRRVSPPQRRNKFKIIFSGDLRVGENSLRPASVEFVRRGRTNYARSQGAGLSKREPSEAGPVWDQLINHCVQYPPTSPTPIWVYVPFRIFARWPSEFIQAFTTASAVE